MSKIKTVLVGYGYWGPNLARNLNNNPSIELSAILEIDTDLHKKIKDDYPEIQIFKNIEEINSDYDAAVLSTPATTHFSIGSQLLKKGLNVLIEKPLATNVEEAQNLVILRK